MHNIYNLVENKSYYLGGEFNDSAFLSDFNDFLLRNWKQRETFYDDGVNELKQRFIHVDTSGKRITTNDYIGTIGFKNNQINIFPKIYKSGEEDKAPQYHSVWGKSGRSHAASSRIWQCGSLYGNGTHQRAY